MANDIVDNLDAGVKGASMDELARALPKSGPPAIEIAEWVRSQIRANRFVPGQRLVEVDIIRRTGGSRFKVREAFQRLAAEGLLEIEEFRGASVREASLDEVSQLYRARAALEGICAADFTRQASDADKEKLRIIAEKMENCVESGSPELFGRLNADWHAMLMRVTGNDVIADLVGRLNTPVHHLMFESFYRGDRMTEATKDHRVILDAILRGDPDAAETAMRRHVENGLQFLTSLDRALFGD